MLSRFLLCLALLSLTRLHAEPAPAVAATPAPKPAALKGPEKWEKEIAAFDAKDSEHPFGKGGIVFTGSSSIRMWKTLEQDFPHHRVLNHGFGGSEISDSIYYADRTVLRYEPRMIVFYAGANDINSKKTPERVAADFKTFVEKVRAKLPEVEIAFIAISGNPKRWSQIEEVKKANALVADYCAKTPHLKYIDTFSAMMGPDGQPKPDIFIQDNLHMNDKGYRIWTEVVGKFLPAPDKQ